MLKRSIHPLFLILLLSLVMHSCGQLASHADQREQWDMHNNPLLFLPRTYKRQVKDLPLSGELEDMPWTDTYWPTHLGGIAQRWNRSHLSDREQFKFVPPTKSAVAKMSLGDRAKLSPAEKFDIYVGNYKYPLFSSERGRTSPDAAHWHGLCHGWAPAALAWAEPKAVLVKNNEGIEIPFGSADIKALLTIYMGEYSQNYEVYLASRCNIDIGEHPDASRRPECRDINAGSFHLVLANELGLNKRGFVADVTRDIQVWNQPVYGFSAEATEETNHASPGAARGTVREISYRTVMTFGAESGPDWEHRGALARSITYEYRIEVNAKDEVIGGEWLSPERPDFIWRNKKPEFKDAENLMFSRLKGLYLKASSADEDIPNPAVKRRR